MLKLYQTKDEDGEFYFQIELTPSFWKFIDKITSLIYDENDMIDDHYRREFKDNDYFSFKKDGVIMIIIMTKDRIHVAIFGYSKNKEIKDVLFKEYFF